MKNQGWGLNLYRCSDWRKNYSCDVTNTVSLRVSHIPGKLNTLADMLSWKGQILPTEWILNPEIFKQIQSWFPTIQVNLFANCLNHELPTIYVSPFPDNEAWGVDALSFQWETLTAYAYLPTSLISQILKQIQESDRIIILIAPCWPNQPWFLILLELLVDFSTWLPTSRKMLRQPIIDLPLKTRKALPTCVAFIKKDLVERGFPQEVVERAERPEKVIFVFKPIPFQNIQ